MSQEKKQTGGALTAALPPETDMKIPALTLPTSWQTVLFYNYGYVSTERLAKVLECDTATVEREAARLGLPLRPFAKDFEERGFITLIRNSWFLLPYDQICTLLGWEEERLRFVLEKEDFLDVKLGRQKPVCKPVVYSPLSEDQLLATKQAAECFARYAGNPKVHPFDFFPQDSETSTPAVSSRERNRIVHGYLSPCGDPFLTDCADTLPDALLARYRQEGVSGIWLHGLLSNLSPYPFLPALSKGYEQRRENLRSIIKRCKKYGIGVYLYFNEPRALPAEVREDYPHMIGSLGRGTLCMETAEARDYLYTAVKDLCAAVPDLGGIFTITMSENATHCNYSRTCKCPRCASIPPYQSAATVNNIINRAMKDSGCKGELIANLWGWSPFLGWQESETAAGIDLLDPDISVMCVSEYDLEIEKGGVKGRVIDYSISNPGPSKVSRTALLHAGSRGHRVYGKIQASNSWECSAVPYLPVFDLVAEHLQNLSSIGVEDLFLTWTLGGYPSPSVGLCAAFEKEFDLDAWYASRFGEHGDGVHKAVKVFCKAFREFPFSISVLYFSPATLGCANLWELEPSEKTSTMVCYSFDDMETWMKPYPYEIYTGQMEKLITGWREGIDLLSSLPDTPAIAELKRYAKASCLHFESDLHHTRFANAKREGDKETMRACICKEKTCAEELLALMREDAKIGFEASNHYFYTERNLMEKILRMERMLYEIPH